MRNFESTKSNKPRRSAEAQEAFAARKGKLHKTQRGRDDWSKVDAATTKEAVETLHENAVTHFSHGVARWHV